MNNIINHLLCYLTQAIPYRPWYQYILNTHQKAWDYFIQDLTQPKHQEFLIVIDLRLEHIIFLKPLDNPQFIRTDTQLHTTYTYEGYNKDFYIYFINHSKND